MPLPPAHTERSRCVPIPQHDMRFRSGESDHCPAQIPSRLTPMERHHSVPIFLPFSATWRHMLCLSSYVKPIQPYHPYQEQLLHASVLIMEHQSHSHTQQLKNVLSPESALRTAVRGAGDKDFRHVDRRNSDFRTAEAITTS